MACTTGQTCGGTPISCKLLDGQPCTVGMGSQCLSGMCKPFYRDADGDMQGAASMSTGRCGTAPAAPAGYVANADDCCDSNAMVKKTNPQDPPVFYTTPATTCGTHMWNYNCDTDLAERQNTTTATCAGDFCSDKTGFWWGTVPACGQSGKSGGVCNGQDCCTNGSCLLHPTQPDLVQGCR
jgi:hypothetical protein